ncbi:MAG: tetratricopeptide repeat protein [Alphaproteobacteria bacterium]
MIKRPLVVIAATLLCLSACAGSYSDRLAGSYGSAYGRGSEALRAKDFEAAAEQYGFAAGSGHPKALIAYGRLFASGQGVERDPARAAALFEEAYQKSSSFKSRAAYELGLLLMEGGDGLEADQARARELMAEALDGGEIRAASTLGRIYQKGQGVEPDPGQAIVYYREAAPTNAYAARDLALLLAETGAAEAEIAEATELAVGQFEARAEAGDDGSWIQLARIFSSDEIVDRDSDRVMRYLENVDASGDPRLQINLARIYEQIGARQEQNRMLRLAADAGDVRAQTRLARIYLQSRSPDANGAVGRYYAERAIGQGSESAMFYLGLAMLRGDVVDRAPLLAETLLRRAREKGHLGAGAALGTAILNGELPDRTPGEGEALLQEAAEQGSADAMRILGFAYLEGENVEGDEGRALDWLERAAEAGDRRARDFLAEREGV